MKLEKKIRMKTKRWFWSGKMGEIVKAGKKPYSIPRNVCENLKTQEYKIFWNDNDIEKDWCTALWLGSLM